MIRPLSAAERAAIEAILSHSESTVPLPARDAPVRVLDGGMGSLSFDLEGTHRFGRMLGDLEFVDADGVPVLASVFADTKGELYELDLFKADYSTTCDLRRIGGGTRPAPARLLPLLAAPSRRALRKLARESGKVLVANAELPQSPFSRRGGAYSFCEWDRAVDHGLARPVSRLARLSGDDHVTLLQTTNAAAYRLARGGYYGGLTIPAALIRSDYGAILHESADDSWHESLHVLSTEFVLFGSTGTWAMWANRGNDVAILRTDSLDSSWRSDSPFFVGATAAWEELVLPGLRPEFRTPEFEQAFLRSFPSSV